MASEMLGLAKSTSDAELAGVFQRLADQYKRLAETQEKLDRTDDT